MMSRMVQCCFSSTNMRTPALLRNFSLRLAGKLSTLVAPWPEQSEFGWWLSEELESLQHHPKEELLGSAWLLDALDLTLAAHKKAHHQLVHLRDKARESCQPSFWLPSDVRVKQLSGSIQNHLRDSIDMLDVCNNLRERLDTVNKYTESLRIALHCLEGQSGPSSIALARANTELEQCLLIERRCAELGSCSSMLRRLGDRLVQDSVHKAKDSKGCTNIGTCDSELHETLCGSKSLALLTCGALAIALSFKSKRGLPHVPDARAKAWCNTLQDLHKTIKSEIDGRRRKSGSAVMNELRAASEVSWGLRELISCQLDWRTCSNTTPQNRELRPMIDSLKRWCEELEMGVDLFMHRVDELYRLLISVRMCELDLLP